MIAMDDNNAKWNAIMDKLLRAREGDGSAVFTTEQLDAVIGSIERNEM